MNHLIKAAQNMSDKGYEESTHQKQADFAKKRNYPLQEMEDKDYDVVIDTLQKKRDALWKMTQQNMNADMYNIMDQIRLEQIAQLERAIERWRDDGK